MALEFAADPALLNLLAAVAVLFAVGHAAGERVGARVPPLGRVAVLGMFTVTVALLVLQARLEPWAVVFPAALAFGFSLGSPAAARSKDARVSGLLLGWLAAMAVAVAALTFQWWYAPLALLALLAIGLAAQAWSALRPTREDTAAAPTIASVPEQAMPQDVPEAPLVEDVPFVADASGAADASFLGEIPAAADPVFADVSASVDPSQFLPEAWPAEAPAETPALAALPQEDAGPVAVVAEAPRPSVVRFEVLRPPRARRARAQLLSRREAPSR